jgi:lysophospholipase L1-like esterase
VDRIMTTRAAAAVLCAGSLATALGGAELFLRLARPQPDPYYYQKHPDGVFRAHYVPSSFPPGGSWTFRAEPGLPGMREAPIRFSVNNLGFRGERLASPKPAGEVRVFMVGGSTTEGLFLDDSETITRVLQDQFAGSGFPGVRVYGAARSGDRSYDHVAMLVHRLVHLEPDLVIVFAGVNDLIADINGADYLLMSGVRADGYSWSRTRTLAMLATELQLPRLFHAALRPTRYAEVVEQIPWDTDYRRRVALRRSLPVAATTPQLSPDAFGRNLTTMAALARAHGFAITFMTQATTWNSTVDPAAEDWHWMNAGRDVAFAGEWMDAAMEIYNDVTRNVATRGEGLLFDFAALMPKSLQFFYDDVHFNVRGAREAGTLLAEFLIASLWSARSEEDES